MCECARARVCVCVRARALRPRDLAHSVLNVRTPQCKHRLGNRSNMQTTISELRDLCINRSLASMMLPGCQVALTDSRCPLPAAFALLEVQPSVAHLDEC